MARRLPAPGTERARQMYCTCTLETSDYGRSDHHGYGLFRPDCPLHGARPEDELPASLSSNQRAGEVA